MGGDKGGGGLRQTVTNGDKGGRGSKIGIFTVTYFLNGPIGKLKKNVRRTVESSIVLGLLQSPVK